MSQLPGLIGKEVIKALRKVGFERAYSPDSARPQAL